MLTNFELKKHKTLPKKLKKKLKKLSPTHKPRAGVNFKHSWIRIPDKNPACHSG